MALVHDRSYRTFYRGILPEEALTRRTIEEREGEWRAVLEGATGASWISIAESRPAGICFAAKPQTDDVPAGAAEVFTLFVAPEHVRTGHGRALVEAALAWMRAEGRTSAVLWCLEDNERARRFYEALGWALDPSALPRQIGPYEDVREVRYRIDLGGGAAVRPIVGIG